MRKFPVRRFSNSQIDERVVGKAQGSMLSAILQDFDVDDGAVGRPASRVDDDGRLDGEIGPFHQTEVAGATIDDGKGEGDRRRIGRRYRQGSGRTDQCGGKNGADFVATFKAVYLYISRN